MKKNINTEQYWNWRFASGDWENKNGREQTKAFAKEQIKKYNLPKNLNGVILDFGCGLGDAIPVYHQYFPLAKLIGVDHSEVAIRKCQEKYGSLAIFIKDDGLNIPFADIIIASNVFEHITNYNEVAIRLLNKCKRLFIIVPYKQKLADNNDSEHINSFDENSFSQFEVIRTTIYRSKGFKQRSLLWIFWNVYIKNILRFLLYGMIIKYNAQKQIMFEIKGFHK